MPHSRLEELAYRFGIARDYWGPHGAPVEAPEATRRHILSSLGIPAGTDEEISQGLSRAAHREPPPLVNPHGHRCFLPRWLEESRAWGVSCQLYELRSARDWGIGDFADLAALCAIGGQAGADFAGVTPLHALFLSDPRRCSPFSPSSRRFLNPIHIAVDRVSGFDPAMADAATIERLRDADLVDYPAVTALKLGALRAIWKGGRGIDDRAAFDAFRRDGGEALRRHALFEALSAEMEARGHGSGWTGWPSELQDPADEAVAAFAEAQADDVAFHAWLQWLADRQLGEAAEAARRAGMRIGLYLDLAVGEAPDGSAVWSARDMFVGATSIGAPPDYFSATGQEWGVAALSPPALSQTGHAYLRDLFAAASRHAGALRIDHAMSLWQLFLVPEGGTPADGAYLRYPVAELLGVLAEVSHANETVMIGEDLGYVPEGFREVMEQAAILSYRILYFEKGHDGWFRPPEHYPRQAIACLSTHDLATLEGWWAGSDITLRRDHGLIDAGHAEAQYAERARERGALIAALGSAGAGWEAAAAAPEAGLPESLAAAIHGFVADTPCLMASVRLADLVGEREPTNLPGTVDAFPNWRRKCPVALEELAGRPLFREITREMAARRPRHA